eukprot:1546-Heterococcus_DN1.PRE.2
MSLNQRHLTAEHNTVQVVCYSQASTVSLLLANRPSCVFSNNEINSYLAYITLQLCAQCAHWQAFAPRTSYY